jgi:hypothetical protein
LSLEVPSADEEEEWPAGSLDPEVDDLLRRLLVGELEVKVDPISGRATAVVRRSPLTGPPNRNSIG